MKDLSDTDRALLYALQRGLPLEARPFLTLGTSCGLAESDVIERAKAYVADGLLRRFGAVFDARRLGYRSVLCAASVASNELEGVAAGLLPHAGITHCYLRGWPDELDPVSPGGPDGSETPNLWFTLAMEEERFDAGLRDVQATVGESRLLVLPAKRRFKIDVVFDPRERDRMETFPGALGYAADDRPAISRLSDRERAAVRRLQGNLPICPRPLASVAEQTGYAEDDLLALLQAWRKAGVLRRFAFIARHRKMGFTANGMCTWNVPSEQALEKGRRLACSPEVTHCYERLLDPRFPFNLYAMIHSNAWARTQELFVQLGREAGLEGGRLLLSLHEFKKTSMRYFEEND